MMRLRIYIDTSVIGGRLDKEFQNASMELIDKFKRGEMIVVISELTTLELKDAPQEAVNLAGKYITEGVIGRGRLVDAEHIAIATINRVLVSWNFGHIVNLQKIRGYKSVNLKYGYPLLEIRSPLEVITYEE